MVDDIKFWNKITKVVYSRIHSEDNNLNIEVKDSTKEVNFYTNQITFHDHGGTQLGYIDSSGVIRGLTVDGHATDLDITILEGNVETLSSNINILYGNVGTLSSNIVTLHGNVDTLSSNIETLHGNIETVSSNIGVLHGNVETLSSNIEILHGNVLTLTDDLESNTARLLVVESNIYYTYGEGITTGNISTLHTIVETLETDLTENTERIAAIEADYVTNADLVTSVVPTAVGAGILTAASTWFTGATGATKSVGGFFEQLASAEAATPDFELINVVQKPSDWTSYPPLVGGTPVGNTNLKSYTERKSAIQGATQADAKILELVDGSSQYLKLRDASVNASGNRNGVQGIDFVRTTASEEFGENECADWRLTTNSICGLDIYRKATGSLGALYDGNVIECDADGDVNVVKVSGLKINNSEVATKSFVATAVDILNNTNIGATATGASAGVSVTNKASGRGCGFQLHHSSWC